jgi:hypothetical protein
MANTLIFAYIYYKEGYRKKKFKKKFKNSENKTNEINDSELSKKLKFLK